ncbi:hypothetical protein BBP40_007196 [Aspergillus hancockii]|nr:hypothetical protein BBP40_007196 [Aspergillus hancockii]
MDPRRPVQPSAGQEPSSPYRGPQDLDVSHLPSFQRTAPRHQGEFPSLGSLGTHLPTVEESPPHHSDQTPTPTPSNPYSRSIWTPLPAPRARVPLPLGQTELMVPGLHRIEPIEAPEQAPDLRKSFDTVAAAHELPIGSLVHTCQPPKWGVVKVSNIPYSVTKLEMKQFVGRQAKLLSPEKGCAIHIIMERSTAKTMDCYIEFENVTSAEETVKQINRVWETGHSPRLGSRRIEVELSSQDDLLKDLFPRAKCIKWEDSVPNKLPNFDPYSTGFAGFFTSEEIVSAIRHAEIPHRSPFSVKCPQRTFESTISTLYKFPWYATELYTVDCRNHLFELVNRHILALVFRMARTNTVGLDQKLLHELLRAGLDCPAFNERQKYCLCTNSKIGSEISKPPSMSKWFPFDSLVKLPNFDNNTYLYYVMLISKGAHPENLIPQLRNLFPENRPDLISPYGCVWFEWSPHFARQTYWEDAVQYEKKILGHLVLSGWVAKDKVDNPPFYEAAKICSYPSPFSTPMTTPYSTPQHTRNVAAHTHPSLGAGASYQRQASQLDIYATPSRRQPGPGVFRGFHAETQGKDPWNEARLLWPSARARDGVSGHRNTKSSPDCFGP